MNLCELLGVKVGEEFVINNRKCFLKHKIVEDGRILTMICNGCWIYDKVAENMAIKSGVTSFNKIRPLKEEEVTILRYVDGDYAYINSDGNNLYLFKCKEDDLKLVDVESKLLFPVKGTFRFIKDKFSKVYSVAGILNANTRMKQVHVHNASPEGEYELGEDKCLGCHAQLVQFDSMSVVDCDKCWKIQNHK